MSGLGTNASGFMGLAFEAAYGTAVVPARFFPIKSETLTLNAANQQRRVIRGLADVLGHVAGNQDIVGEVEMELLADVFPYFLYCSRNTIVKSGAGPYVYTCTPAHYGSQDNFPVGKKGLTLTVVRNGEVFVYAGCVVSGFEITVDNGIPYIKFSIVGKSEATGALPVYAAVTTDVPFAANTYSIELPTASTVFDVVNFTFKMTDNAEVQHRLDTGLTPQWVKFGQREVSLDVERDFSSRTEWDAFKALTTSSVTISVTQGASAIVAIKMANAYRETMTVEGLSDQGAATMQQVTFTGDYDTATSKSYEIVVTSATSIV